MGMYICNVYQIIPTYTLIKPIKKHIKRAMPTLYFTRTDTQLYLLHMQHRIPLLCILITGKYNKRSKNALMHCMRVQDELSRPSWAPFVNNMQSSVYKP